MTVQSLQTELHTFSLLAVERLYADAVFNSELSGYSPEKLPVIKNQVVQTLTPHLSGVLLNTQEDYYTLDFLADKTGVGFSLERNMEEHDPFSIPPLNQQWGVVACSNNSAVAKLTLFYNPREEKSLEKRRLVYEIFDSCWREHIEFVLELVVFPLSDPVDEQRRSEDQLQAVHEFKKAAHLYVLPLPINPITCVTVTAELDIPWILGQSFFQKEGYEQYKENLRAALESGAAGFAVGPALFDGVLLNDVCVDENEQQLDAEQIDERLSKRLTGVVMDRVVELNRIVKDLQN